MDCLNEQLITEPSGFRLGQTPSLLDLVTTSGPEIYANLNMEDPLGKCDHAILYFSVKNQKIKGDTSDNKNIYKEMDV